MYALSVLCASDRDDAIHAFSDVPIANGRFAIWVLEHQRRNSQRLDAVFGMNELTFKKGNMKLCSSLSEIV